MDLFCKILTKIRKYPIISYFLPDLLQVGRMFGLGRVVFGCSVPVCG